MVDNKPPKRSSLGWLVEFFNLGPGDVVPFRICEDTAYLYLVYGWVVPSDAAGMYTLTACGHRESGKIRN